MRRRGSRVARATGPRRGSGVAAAAHFWRLALWMAREERARGWSRRALPQRKVAARGEPPYLCYRRGFGFQGSE